MIKRDLNHETMIVTTYCELTGTIEEPTFTQYYARGFAIAHLNWNGSLKSLMTDDSIWVECYLECDGFEDVDLERASNDLEWDWSHVRDSSYEAIERAADLIARKVWNAEGIEALASSAYDQFVQGGLDPLLACDFNAS